MRVLDLFSGIGGFSLGLERAGMETASFCEIDPFCRRVLAKHWPEVPCYDDVRTLTAERLASDGVEVDIICGGFPCQDISSAGQGAGLAGERSGLWSEYARIIGEVRPRYVIVENVAALLFRGMGDVLGDIAALGYDAEWSIVSACALGAPHVRERMWIVAYPNVQHGWKGFWGSSTQKKHTIQGIGAIEGAGASWRTRMENPSALYGGANGISGWMDRNHSLGNAVVPQIPEMIGRAIMAAESTP